MDSQDPDRCVGSHILGELGVGREHRVDDVRVRVEVILVLKSDGRTYVGALGNLL